MDDLKLDLAEVSSWFETHQDNPFVLVHISAAALPRVVRHLPGIVRRCYILDDSARQNAERIGRPVSEVVASRLPDAGSVMSGDFGEIIAYLHRSAMVPGAIGPKKWRLKHDRTKPTPGSDVVHFVLPQWPEATESDRLVCSEVKSKATAGVFEPIKEALEHSGKDVTGRMAKTLVWMRERAMTTDLGDIQLAQLERFINLSDHPPAARQYFAVAVIDGALAPDELSKVPNDLPSDRGLVVILVPTLKEAYTSVFEAAAGSLV